MTQVDALVDWLGRRPSIAGATVLGWRLEVVYGHGLRAGVRDSRLGGPYEGPGVATRLGGSLELHWSDGLLTRTGLDRQAVISPPGELATWRAGAVRERRGRLPPLAGPTALPNVETFDPAVDRAVRAGAVTGLSIVRQLIDGVRSAGVGRIDAVTRASRGERTVATSRGLWSRWDETACSIELWADELASASYGRRCLPSADDLDRLIEQVSTLAPQLKSVQELPPMARGVIFMPAVVHELVGRFLLPNLSGRAIRDGRSPFTRADVEAARSIVRADLSLVVDTTVPLELATAPCSGEGVPAGRVSLIADGRLLSPILDLATADDFGLPPTPVPRNRPTALLTSTSPLLDLNGAVELLDRGVVVRDLPGLHTQQARRASYALGAPDAQVVVDGRAGGCCAVRLAGNLLDHLGQPSTCLIRVPGDRGVGLLVLSGVELSPA